MASGGPGNSQRAGGDRGVPADASMHLCLFRDGALEWEPVGLRMRFSITQLLFAVALFGIVVSFCATSHFDPKYVSLVAGIAFSNDGKQLAVLRVDGQDAGVTGKAYVGKVVTTLSITDPTATAKPTIASQWIRYGDWTRRSAQLLEKLLLVNRRHTLLVRHHGMSTADEFDLSQGFLQHKSCNIPNPAEAIVGAKTSGMVAASSFDQVDVFIPGEKSSICTINTKLGEEWRTLFISFSCDDSIFATASPEKVVFWNSNNGTHNSRFIPYRSRSKIADIAFATCDDTLAIAEGDRLVLYDPVHGRERTTYGNVPNSELAFSSDGRWLAGIRDSKTVVVFDVRSGRKTSEYRFASGVTVLAWSPQKSVLAIGTSSNQVSLWDPFSNDDPVTFSAPGTTERWMPYSTFVWMVLVWGLCACSVYWARRRRMSCPGVLVQGTLTTRETDKRTPRNGVD